MTSQQAALEPNIGQNYNVREDVTASKYHNWLIITSIKWFNIYQIVKYCHPLMLDNV